MARYRYLAYDLRTNVLLQELPLRTVQFGGILNGAGSFAAELPINVNAQASPGVYRSMAADYLIASQPGRTVIYIERDGVLLPDGAFIIWTRSYSPDTESLQLGGLSLWSYFQHRIIDADVTYTAIDQLTVAQSIITAIQADTGGSIGVIVGSEVSGVPRTRVYNAYECKFAGEAIEQLSSVNNGFDFGIDVSYAGSTPTKTFRCDYPQRGRSATASGHVFETGRNIITYAYPEDASLMANRWFGVGAGDGLDMLRSTAARTDLIDLGYPLLDGSGSYKDVSVQATLDQHTLADVGSVATPVIIPQVTVTAGGDPPIGGWIVGDFAKFVFGTDPAKFDPRFPTRTELVCRIVGYDAIPGDEGQETVRLILN